MMLTMARREDVAMPGAVERLLELQLPDGGWNCRRDASHASVHSTLSALEALGDHSAAAAGREFLLRHRLFRSHRTGHVMRSDFTRFSFPTYWYYDVLRALDYWREHPWDDRLWRRLNWCNPRRWLVGGDCRTRTGAGPGWRWSRSGSPAGWSRCGPCGS